MRSFLLFLAAILILPGAAPPQSGSLRDAMLSVHNGERRQLGVPRLKWNDALARDALTHAEWMARTGRFEHSTARNNQGENLWAGTRGGYHHAEMAQAWLDEKRYYRDSPSPNNSSSGKWSDVGHYTQMVWSTTTDIGCAIASSATTDYLVCRYSPPGNYAGQKAYQPFKP